MNKAIYAASFDPLTKGHEWVLKQSCLLFKEVLVVIAHNPQKQSFFNLQQKLSMFKKLEKDLPIKVHILEKEYLADFAKRHKVNYLIRGLRNGLDLEYEKNIETINKKINPKLQTIYMSAPTELSHVSSSLVKSLVGLPGWMKTIQDLVSPEVLSLFLYQINHKELFTFWTKAHGNKNLNWFEKLLGLHSQPHRFYHNTDHLIQCLSNMESLTKDKDELKILTYITFFHDAIYNPQSKTNEEDSALLWREFVKEGKISEYINEVVFESILNTKNHNLKSKYPITEKFLDLDLSILGASETLFLAYEDGIRLEYGFVPEEIFSAERHKIMSAFKDPFKTPIAKTLWQKALEINLKKY